MVEGYAFYPTGGGPSYPITQGQYIEGLVPVDGSSIDTNLLLFGFGVLALLGLFGLFAYLSSKKKEK